MAKDINNNIPLGAPFHATNEKGMAAHADEVYLDGYNENTASGDVTNTDNVESAIKKLSSKAATHDTAIADAKKAGTDAASLAATNKTTVDNYTVNGKKVSTNPVIAKEDVGLDNVDNTSDLDKPVSTATQTALDKKQNVLGNSEDIIIKDGKTYFADRTVDAANFQSRGRVYLRKNIVDGKNVLTQDMINQADTTYVIMYDFDLNGQTITIPERCTLDFQGGSIINGTIVGNNTIINDVTDNYSLGADITGTFYTDTINDSNIRLSDNTEHKLLEIINSIKGFKFIGEEYDISDTINIDSLSDTVIDFNNTTLIVSSSDNIKNIFNVKGNCDNVEISNLIANSTNNKALDRSEFTEEDVNCRVSNIILFKFNSDNNNIKISNVITNAIYSVLDFWGMDEWVNYSNNIHIHDCTFNDTYFGIGFHICNNITIERCNITINSNSKYYYAHAIYNTHGANNFIIKDCTLNATNDYQEVVRFRGDVNKDYTDVTNGNIYVYNSIFNGNSKFNHGIAVIGSYSSVNIYNSQVKNGACLINGGEHAGTIFAHNCILNDGNYIIPDNSISYIKEGSTANCYSCISNSINFDHKKSSLIYINTKFFLAKNLGRTVYNNDTFINCIFEANNKIRFTLSKSQSITNADINLFSCNINNIDIDFGLVLNIIFDKCNITNGSILQINNNIKIYNSIINGEKTYYSSAFPDKGNTDSRPTNISNNYQYFDTTLNKPIWWTGSKWVDATGATV